MKFGMEFPSQEKDSITQDRKEVEAHRTKSPLKMRLALEAQLKTLSKKFEVQGEENLNAVQKILEEDPEAKFIIAASHFSDLDVAAAVKAFGNEFNVQITAESLLPEQYRSILGKDNVTSIDYEEGAGGKAGVFNPRNFDAVGAEMQKGKTPWIAAHEFSRGTEMERARIGPAYLAQKTGAYIIPAALEVQGQNMKLDEPGAMLKQIKNRLELAYHVGIPFRLEKVDIAPIETVLKKRSAGERPERSELEAARAAHQKLKEQAELIARAIGDMLPEEQRGEYKEEGKQKEGLVA